jgi:hypothetical protein
MPAIVHQEFEKWIIEAALKVGQAGICLLLDLVRQESMEAKPGACSSHDPQRENEGRPVPEPDQER